MFRITRCAVAAGSMLALTACATMNVSSHVERGVDFAQYRTYDWGPPDNLPVGDPRLDNNPFFHDYLRGAVEKKLALKGFELSKAGTPDLLIHYHASVNQRIDVYEVDRQYGYCYGNCQPQVVEFEEGTIVLDLVDARTNSVVWRGWAQDSMKGVIDDQKRLERKIDEGVTRMLERLPKALQHTGEVPATGARQ